MINLKLINKGSILKRKVNFKLTVTKLLALSVLFLFATPNLNILAAQSESIKYFSQRIEDSMFSILKATVNGKEYTIIDEKAERCLDFEDQRDFNNNGSQDALITNIYACGGNCCPNNFFFVTYKGNGIFNVGGTFGSSWGDLKIEQWQGKPSIVLIENNEGFNLAPAQEITYRYVLKDGEAEVVEHSIRKHIPALRDMKSAEFEYTKRGEYRKMEFDLNGDGKKDVISGVLNERWGRIMWSVKVSEKNEVSSKPQCKRIGILATKTAGFHNLVCDFDQILRWNGSRYL